MSEEKRLQQFAFFESYQNAIDRMPTDGAKLQMYQAITQYMFNGVAPDFQGEQLEIMALNIAWELVVPILNLSLKRSIAGSMGRGVERPSMRGNQNASKGEENKAKSKQNQSKTKQNQAKQNYRIGEDRIGKEKEKEMEGGNARVKRENTFAPTPNFSIPTIDAIIAVMQGVCEDKKVAATHDQLKEAADRFFDFYDGRSWTTAKGIKLRKWEGEARNWTRGDISNGKFKTEPTTPGIKRVPKQVITFNTTDNG